MRTWRASERGGRQCIRVKRVSGDMCKSHSRWCAFRDLLVDKREVATVSRAIAVVDGRNERDEGECLKEKNPKSQLVVSCRPGGMSLACGKLPNLWIIYASAEHKHKQKSNGQARLTLRLLWRSPLPSARSGSGSPACPAERDQGSIFRYTLNSRKDAPRGCRPPWSSARGCTDPPAQGPRRARANTCEESASA
jgi:hypothetical protein